MANNVKGIIDKALQEVNTIDVHCHLNPAKPGADNIADILLYHHMRIELVSSTLGRTVGSSRDLHLHLLGTEETPPLERVYRGIDLIKNVPNTTLALFVRWIMKDLYGIEEEISRQNVEKIATIVEDKGKDFNWQEKILDEYCGLDYAISAEFPGRPAYSPRIMHGLAGFPCNLVDGKDTDPANGFAKLEKRLGANINNAQDYRDGLMKHVSNISSDKFSYFGARVLPYMTLLHSTDEEITSTIKKIKDGKPVSNDELGGFCYAGMKHILDGMGKTGPRVIQVVVGSEVFLPHRAMSHWSSEFAIALAHIANVYEEFHFDLSTASEHYIQDFAIMAKHIPNVSVAGYWWHTLYPYYIRKTIETRLDMVPLNKIIGFFSDAYHCEWIYPKLRMVKEVMGEVLLERVARGWYTVDLALDIIQKVFYDNPKAIYRIK
ncbi:MAG: hypothetical protein JXA52_04925 [Planctomycetes bacterium]|nr:hypothetical protein [Planctomycetota bacterium]